MVIALAVVLAVALVGGSAAVALTVGGDDDRDAAAGTEPATTDSATPEPSSSSSSSPSPSFTDSLVSPGQTTPTPPERRRTRRDVDRGLAVYDDVYIQPAANWRRVRKLKYQSTLIAIGKGIAGVHVAPYGYDAVRALPAVVDGFVADHSGVRKGKVQAMRPANSNIASQATVAFTARLRVDGVTLSMAGRCTTMTGVESIHNVTVTFCIEVLREVADVGFADGRRMLASVAGSI